MSYSPRTAAASTAARNLIDMHVDRRAMGEKARLLALSWAAINGLITEPEASILTGRTGMLRRYAKQGYLIQNDLPPGLKSAPHFPHLHYYHLSEKGMMTVTWHLPYLMGLGNLDLRQRTYLHDFIGRIEAAWRVRNCLISGYIPEARLPDLASQAQKQHDGHFISFYGARVGLEVEAADWKSGNKLAMFAAQCLNSISNNRVQRVLILVQNQHAVVHYSKPFAVGEIYHPEWVKESGRWRPRKSSATVVSKELAAKVKVQLIRSESEIRGTLQRQPTIFLSDGEPTIKEVDFLE